MLKRCYSASFHRANPSYIGCSVDPDWLTFSVFRNWMEAQDWQGKQLDKDLIAPGNKFYSPSTCRFIDQSLNLFLTDRRRARGDWPIGTSFKKSEGKFVSQCCNPFTGENEYLGLFACPESAHEAWRTAKHAHALRYADQQTDPRIAEALRARFACRILPTNTRLVTK
jgi:hypothetical protein